jgi:hypothetical protein
MNDLIFDPDAFIYTGDEKQNLRIIACKGHYHK